MYMISNRIGNIFCVEKQFPKKVHAFFVEFCFGDFQ